MTFGQVLKEARKQHGLTLKEVGDMAGVSKVTISGIENGKWSPSLRTAMKISNHLGFSLDQIAKHQAIAESIGAQP